MAKQGFAKETIQAQGRWSSAAYETYCKQGRGTRLQVQKEVAECLTRESLEPMLEILVDEE